MYQMPQQQFDYGIVINLPPPPHEQEGPSQGTEVIHSTTVMAPVLTDGIWGTQPLLHPSLMEIAKIAVLTRKIFGAHDLTLLIPKVRFSLPLFGFSA